jgi:hypothetical protein
VKAPPYGAEQTGALSGVEGPETGRRPIEALEGKVELGVTRGRRF